MDAPGLFAGAAMRAALTSPSPSLRAELELGGSGNASPGTSGKAPVGTTPSSSALGGSGKLPWLPGGIGKPPGSLLGAPKPLRSSLGGGAKPSTASGAPFSAAPIANWRRLCAA